MPLIVTHQAPDLDAITSVWLLQRFDAQHFAGSSVAFVPAGTTLSAEEARQRGFEPEQVVHVDTGQGEFDHHMPERAGKEYCAAMLVHKHCCRVHPELASDQALQLMVDHVTDVDHFGEAFWPDSNHPRYEFMLHQIITGMDLTETNDDQYQVELGGRLLDFVYQGMNQHVRAVAALAEGASFPLKSGGEGFAVESSNDEVLAVAQRSGKMLVIKKDAKNGQVRIKARPDAPFTLAALHEKIKTVDVEGTWYYHPSGLMLINGSRKTKGSVPSPLTLDQLVTLAKSVL